VDDEVREQQDEVDEELTKDLDAGEDAEDVAGGFGIRRGGDPDEGGQLM
jgi:hypothetical protein